MAINLEQRIAELERALTEERAARMAGQQELATALERQMATAEILRVMTKSLTDYQPVLDIVVQRAAQVGAVEQVCLWLVEGDEEFVAAEVGTPEPYVRGYRQRLTPDNIGSLVIEEARTVHFDLHSDPLIDRFAVTARWREVMPPAWASLLIPLLREERAIGYIGLGREGPFSDKEIRLLQTFANQAVIAIENARLFSELQERNRELSEAFVEQAAIADVLRIISRAPTAPVQVLHALAENAARVCAAADAIIWQIEGDTRRVVAHVGPVERIGIGMTAPLRNRSPVSLAIVDRRTIHLRDLTEASEADFGAAKAFQAPAGVRTMLATPLLREGAPIGAIVIRRTEVRPFTDKQIRLLETFADQAVIAIENARLFEEIQNKSQQLEEASHHKSEFLANMSHELRTPLNGILGFSEILLNPDMPVDEETRLQFTTTIHESGQHLLNLINDILDLSKVEAGKMELHPEDFLLQDAVQGVHAVVRALADKKQQTLALDTPDAPITLYHDASRVKQVLFNLLSNAVKFTPEGGSVRTTASLGGGWVEVAVQDTGIGIAPEDQGKVFEEFQQIDSGYARTQQGTGLGLALVRSFVRLMGGDITLRSAIGKGSTFTARLPVRQPEPAATSASI